MSPFASQTLGGHIGRGAGAALLVLMAVWLLSLHGLLPGAAAVAGFVGAVVLLRGCPMCWFIGLFETISAASRGGQAR
jgi:hypothetical protein